MNLSTLAELLRDIDLGLKAIEDGSALRVEFNTDSHKAVVYKVGAMIRLDISMKQTEPQTETQKEPQNEKQ